MSDTRRRNARLRWRAKGQGLSLRKLRRRDGNASRSRMYMLIDPQTNAVAAHGRSGECMSMDEVEEWFERR